MTTNEIPEAEIVQEKPKRTRKTKTVVEGDTTKPKKVKAKKADANEANKVAQPRKKNYINNADLMKEIAISRQQNKMTDELANMLYVLTHRYSEHPDYSTIYSYKDDMRAFALLTVCKVWKSFNPERGSNPFAYFTQIIRHAFYQYLNHEKRQREVKDVVRVEIGQLPSFTYMENYREEREAEYEVVYSHDSDGDEVEERIRRPSYDATLPGVVTEIDYTFNRDDEIVPDDMGTGSDD